MAASDLRLVAGTTFGFSMTWETENEAGELAPVDITGCSAKFVMKAKASGAVLATASTGDGVEIPDGPTGEVVVTLAPEKTAGLTEAKIGQVGYELRVYFPSGDVYSLVIGFVAIVEGEIDD
ncbi:TPA: hypothetical protein ACX3GV_004548 [Vibrio parahaemolyticus]|uniref:hypothetical protein n=1 Tax=Vibrio parahaemolyticus TaxID=670 RepID=UPI000D52FFCF|nr:hypothetical protein [Vibrio parahaemolyticus]AWG87332.1 hypothetical protein Vp2S01_p20021 [Vibrio parahaemolyticus]